MKLLIFLVLILLSVAQNEIFMVMYSLRDLNGCESRGPPRLPPVKIKLNVCIPHQTQPNGPSKIVTLKDKVVTEEWFWTNDCQRPWVTKTYEKDKCNKDPLFYILWTQEAPNQ